MSASGLPDDETRSDGNEPFLARWSRRKRDPEPRAPIPAAPATQAPAEPDPRPRDPETGEAIDEEWVASLPDIATLQPGADLSAFMHKGVPETLRRQALRALWESDPAIRDFVSPALDYAHDYNTPGATYGFGPLTEEDMAQARDFLAEVFTPRPADPVPKDEAEPAQNCDIASQADPNSERDSVRQSDAASQHNQPAETLPDQSAPAPCEDEPAANGPDRPLQPPNAIVHRNIQTPPALGEVLTQAPVAAPRRRRGGGASPA